MRTLKLSIYNMFENPMQRLVNIYDIYKYKSLKPRCSAHKVVTLNLNDILTFITWGLQSLKSRVTLKL